MKTQRDNRIIVDLKKVQYARFYYRNQSGTVFNTKPAIETFMGRIIPRTELALFHPQYPEEPLVERMKRRGITPDVWTPELLLKLTANCCLIYTGDKAIAINKKWCEMIFKKSKKDSNLNMQLAEQTSFSKTI